ncbi:hypothetical protein BJ875DRAFT_467458 [Amylocarpus encephaloides]|uniref:Uncharacterized protein n=1 Tax=Amylocarpus encephaloides TaxID=45428 RepID=A0A9P7YEL7_9HELO|nr:hypothetical protein BJ875DRAFT_467458 [Amylocarpus encephaloides]
MPESSSHPKLPKVNKDAAKQAAKSVLTKFGPVLFTAAVAAAKHHMDEDERKEAAREYPREKERPQIDDRASDKTTDSELRREVRRLKRKLRRKERDVLHHGIERQSSKASSISSTKANIPTIVIGDGDSTIRSHRSPVRGFEQEGSFERKTPRNDYYEHPSDKFSTLEHSPAPHNDEVKITSREVVSDVERQKHRGLQYHRAAYHNHHHRHSSVPVQLPDQEKQEELCNRATEASKVAALAGTLEAIHIGNLHGKWIGPKGKRVGTAVAASFRTSWARGQNPELNDGWEMAANVVRGLVVTRIIHGSTERVEDEWRAERRGRRRRRSF